MIAALIPAVTSLIGNVIDKAVPDKSEAEKLKAQITLEAMKADHSELKAATDVILAEAKGESNVQRSWRPWLMILFGVIIANNYIIYPYLRLFFPDAPLMDIPPDMWTLLQLGVAGYIGGRTSEKLMKTYKEK